MCPTSSSKDKGAIWCCLLRGKICCLCKSLIRLSHFSYLSSGNVIKIRSSIKMAISFLPFLQSIVICILKFYSIYYIFATQPEVNTYRLWYAMFNLTLINEIDLSICNNFTPKLWITHILNKATWFLILCTPHSILIITFIYKKHKENNSKLC